MPKWLKVVVFLIIWLSGFSLGMYFNFSKDWMFILGAFTFTIADGITT